jgi:hypothetical protein
VPPNIQKFLPFILIIFFLLFVVPSLLHHGSKSKTTSLSAQTLTTMNLVDRAEKSYLAAHKGYTPNIADLLVVNRALGPLLGSGIVVSLNTSSNSQTYFAQVASSVISYVRARNGAKLIARSCLVLKSGNGVSCTPKAAKTTTTSTTTTTTTTTGATSTSE